jgi:hypothetical protein
VRVCVCICVCVCVCVCVCASDCVRLSGDFCGIDENGRLLVGSNTGFAVWNWPNATCLVHVRMPTEVSCVRCNDATCVTDRPL